MAWIKENDEKVFNTFYEGLNSRIAIKMCELWCHEGAFFFIFKYIVDLYRRLFLRERKFTVLVSKTLCCKVWKFNCHFELCAQNGHYYACCLVEKLFSYKTADLFERKMQDIIVRQKLVVYIFFKLKNDWFLLCFSLIWKLASSLRNNAHRRP